MGFSNRLKALNLQIVVQAPMSATASSKLLLGAPGSDILTMRIRRICCLTNLGTMPLVSLEAVME